MRPISEEQLQSRLSSGSKSRLRNFRSTLKADRDSRNYDFGLDTEFTKYVRDTYDYGAVKKYLRHLKSSQDGKMFSQGVKSYSQIHQAVLRFSQDNWGSFQWNQNYQSAVAELKRYFSQFRLKSLEYHSDEEMISVLPKTNTHSGFSYLVTGMKEKKEYLGNVFHNYQEEERRAILEGSFNKPILPGCRTQGSGAFDGIGQFTNDCKHKTRLVSMVDVYQIFGELKFAKPIQDVMARIPSYAGGKRPSRIAAIISDMRARYRGFISLDYSSYDQSISDWLIYDAFDILREAFVECDDALYRVIVDDFIHKNFITADGVVYSRKGVPSGSMFTQIIDSVVNWIVINTYFNAIGAKVSMIVMGDDNLFYSDALVDLGEISSYIHKNFGIVVNSDKSSSGSARENPEFLSREWRSDGQFRIPNVVVSKMLYPERFRNYSNGYVSPSVVLYAYILTYPITMYQIMDVDRFLYEHPNLNRAYVMNVVDSRYLPGALAFIREYTMTG